MCDAIRYGDTTMCGTCGTQWDTNDPEPPPCRKKAYPSLNHVCSSGYVTVPRHTPAAAIAPRGGLGYFAGYRFIPRPKRVEPVCNNFLFNTGKLDPFVENVDGRRIWLEQAEPERKPQGI